MEDKKQKGKIRFFTGSTLMDLIIAGEKGVFGYEAGKVYNLVGDKSTGKTFCAAEVISVNKYFYKDKFKWNYDDAEMGCTLNSKKLYGFDLIKKDTLKSETVEDLFINVKKFVSTLKSDQMGIYVIDSLDAIGSEEDKARSEKRVKLSKQGKKLETGSYQMSKQKFLSQEFFRNLVKELANTNCMLLIISQVRANIGVMFGEKLTRSGGKALDFYAHSCIWLANAEKIKKLGRDIGVRIKAKTKKSKTPRPYRWEYAILYYDYGVDNLSANIDYLFGLVTEAGKSKGTLTKPPKIEYNGKEYTRDELIKAAEKEGFEDAISQEVIEIWETIEDSVLSDRKSKFTRIT